MEIQIDTNTQLQDKSKRERRLPIDQPPCVKRGQMAAYPSVSAFVGLSKSGKTTKIKDILIDPEFWGGYYDVIIYLSPTADSDTTLTAELDLPDENIITNFQIEDIQKILDARKAQIKKLGYNKVAKESKMLMILDDVISRPRLLRSNMLIDISACVRHWLVSTIFSIQSLTKIWRPIRLNLRTICFFESNRNETECLVDECCPPQLSKKEFRALIAHATEEPYSFITINRDKPFRQRYLRKFESRLEIR